MDKKVKLFLAEKATTLAVFRVCEKDFDFDLFQIGQYISETANKDYPVMYDENRDYVEIFISDYDEGQSLIEKLILDGSFILLEQNLLNLKLMILYYPSETSNFELTENINDVNFMYGCPRFVLVNLDEMWKEEDGTWNYEISSKLIIKYY